MLHCRACMRYAHDGNGKAPPPGARHSLAMQRRGARVPGPGRCARPAPNWRARALEPAPPSRWEVAAPIFFQRRLAGGLQKNSFLVAQSSSEHLSEPRLNQSLPLHLQITIWTLSQEGP